jgi:hypothetical protein
MPIAPDWYVSNLPCPTCGQVHSRCASDVTEDGAERPCGSAPVGGAHLCAAHGGRALAESRVSSDTLAEEIERHSKVGPLLRRCAVDTKGRTYVESLEDALHRANTMVLLLSLLIETLNIAATSEEVVVAEGTPKETLQYRVIAEGMVGPDIDGNLAVHPYVTLYREWTNTQAQLAKVAADLGLTERQVEVAEAQVQIMSTTLFTILTELEIDLADPRTRRILERNLLAMQSTSVDTTGRELTASATAS